MTSDMVLSCDDDASIYYIDKVYFGFMYRAKNSIKNDKFHTVGARLRPSLPRDLNT